MQYITKAKLYAMVERLRTHLDVSFSSYPLSVPSILSNERYRVQVESGPFKTKGLQAMVKINFDEKGTALIMLNDYRCKDEQNFDCAHELIHIAYHQCTGAQSFQCYEKALPTQNPYLEWQANEGGAELLVPYRLLLPRIKANDNMILSGWSEIYRLKEKLAEDFGVSMGVINIRFESLRYEIDHYLNGTPIEKIELLSHNQQKQRGIVVKSINDLETEDFDEDMKRHWVEKKVILLVPTPIPTFSICPQCKCQIEDTERGYCPICGINFENMCLRKDEKPMKYQGIEQNENMLPAACPKCQNEQIEKGSAYCCICGTFLYNMCSADERQCNCTMHYPGNYRHCIYCGATTTYYNEGWLDSWDGKEISIDAIFAQVDDEDLPF